MQKISIQEILKTEWQKKYWILKYGVVKGNRNTIDIKMDMVKYAGKFSCVILGSSHVKQISSHRYPSLTKTICPSLLNLGTDAASIEDVLVFSYVIANLESAPKKIIIGIDPWTLNMGRGGQWKRYRDKYEQMLLEFNVDQRVDKISDSYLISLITNLLNFQYFKRSIIELFHSGEIHEVERFDISLGYKEDIILPDGSLVYLKTYSQGKERSIHGRDIYKLINEKWYDIKVIKLLEKLILFLNKNGIEAYFVLTPYHQNVWKNNPVTVKAMTVVSKTIRQFAEVWGVQVLGSYDPDKLGCSEEQFFDAAHPKGTCVNRVFLNQSGLF